MGKKRDKANDNIEILVEALIDARREALGSGSCPHSGTCPLDNPQGCVDCYNCKEQYFEKMRDNLLKKYIVR